MAVQDSSYFAYAIIFYQGLGNLLPWNAFITAAAYFATRFCGTAYSSNYENYLSISFTLTQTIGLALSVLYQNRFSTHDKIIYPLLAYSTIFAITTILVLITQIDSTLLFWITVLSSMLCGLAGAFLSGGLFGLSAIFPQSYTAGLMAGQGLAGLMVSLSDVFTSLATKQPEDFCGDDDVEIATSVTDCEYDINYSALAYFTIATFVLLSCAWLFYVLQKLPYTEFLLIKAGNSSPSGVGGASNSSSSLRNSISSYEKGMIREPLIQSSAAGRESSASKVVATGSSLQDDTSIISPSNSFNNRSGGSGGVGGLLNPMIVTYEDGDSTGDDDVVAIAFNSSRLRHTSADKSLDHDGTSNFSSSITSWPSISRVLGIVRVPAFSVMLTFAITLALFPTTTIFLQSENKCKSEQRFYNDLYVPFFFLLFNLFDFTGRIVAGMKPVFNAKNIWIPAVSRLVFVPLFLLSDLSNSQLPVFFHNDAFPVVFMIIFAFSNGYVASSAMMIGPGMTSTSDAGLAGTIMVFCLTFGLLMGSSFSFLVVAISQGAF